ncbi:MAG: beta-ketoacyl-ACP synthase II [Chloroflexi bacterium]|nr:beta-ketoacyl-ACP synthase II [Chloroflexota bacterium]
MGTRVVVTGLGAITPLGHDVSTTWDNLINGRSGAGRITSFDPSPYAIQIACEVKNFEPTKYIEPRDARRMDRCTQFAIVAAQQAIADANLAIDDSNRTDIGVYIGTAVGGIRTLLEQQKVLDEKGPNRVNPLFPAVMIPDTPAGQIAINWGIKGPNMAVVSACATGAHALGEAWETIRRGDARVMLSGGTEAAILPVVLAGFINMKVLATDNEHPEKAAKPWDLNRDGFVMAEGSVIMVLEELEHALQRGANIYCEIVGYGATNDGFHLAAPSADGEGEARAIRIALKKAGMQPQEVQCWNPHGSATALADKYETTLAKEIWGDYAYKLPINSTKSMLGHMMGGAGAVESMTCILAIRDSVIHPTINIETPDPECDLDYVPNVARHTKVDVALCSNMGLGGHNSAIIFRRYDG